MDSLPQILANIGALLTLALGLLGLFAPRKAADLVQLSARTHPGFSEFRATYGGLFIGLAAVPLITQAPVAFLVTACAWLGAAIARIVSIALDKTLNPKNWLAVAFEGGIGLLCLCAIL